MSEWLDFKDFFKKSPDYPLFITQLSNYFLTFAARKDHLFYLFISHTAQQES